MPPHRIMGVVASSGRVLASASVVLAGRTSKPLCAAREAFGTLVPSAFETALAATKDTSVAALAPPNFARASPTATVATAASPPKRAGIATAEAMPTFEAADATVALVVFDMAALVGARTTVHQIRQRRADVTRAIPSSISCLAAPKGKAPLA